MLAPSESYSSWSGRGPREALDRVLRLLTPSLSRSACGGLAPNRRREMRRRARLGCRVRRIDTWRLVGDRSVDLSPQGMLLLSDERIDWGAEVVVSFQATELPIWFDTMAKVVRVVEGRRPNDPGRSLGIKFDTLPSVSRLILRGHLRNLPAAPPQRTPPAHLTRDMIDPDYAKIVDDIWAGRHVPGASWGVVETWR